MAKSDAVKAVLQGQNSLYLMGFDHCCEHVVHGERGLPSGNILLRKKVGNCENRPQIVGGVAPFGG